jgi:hypothetical protein
MTLPQQNGYPNIQLANTYADIETARAGSNAGNTLANVAFVHSLTDDALSVVQNGVAAGVEQVLKYEYNFATAANGGDGNLAAAAPVELKGPKIPVGATFVVTNIYTYVEVLLVGPASFTIGTAVGTPANLATGLTLAVGLKAGIPDFATVGDSVNIVGAGTAPVIQAVTNPATSGKIKVVLNGFFL